MKSVAWTLLYVVMTLLVWALIGTMPTMLLWNWLMPAIFKLPTISFLQACGLMLLSTMLFKTSLTTKIES